MGRGRGRCRWRGGCEVDFEWVLVKDMRVLHMWKKRADYDECGFSGSEMKWVFAIR